MKHPWLQYKETLFVEKIAELQNVARTHDTIANKYYIVKGWFRKRRPTVSINIECIVLV